MDPLLILVASTFVILLALLIVNLYYIHGHYFSHQDHTTTATQTAQNNCVHNEIQTENFLDIQDKEVQNTPQTETTGMDPQNLTTAEQCIQTDRVYYVTLPEQLDHISKQLTINQQDLTHRLMQLINKHNNCKHIMILYNKTCIKNCRNIVQMFYKMYNFS